MLELPEIGEGNKIYLVPKTGTDNNNEYDEYIYINNKWEMLGTITIDLSNYYDKNEINTLLNNKVDKNANITAGTHPKNYLRCKRFGYRWRSITCWGYS